MSRPLELVIEGGPRPRLGASVRELAAFRSIILAFAERDVRVKYKQAVLGIAWAVIQPLAYMAVFTVALGHGARVSGGGVPYAAFALSALVPWNYLQTAVNFGANALVNDASLLRKVYFPRELPVLAAVLGCLLDLGIGFILYAALGPFLGAHISATWLLALPLAVCLAALAFGAGVFLAGLNVYYRDFRFALPVALQLWLFASPVAYPITVIPRRWRTLYCLINPAAGILDAYRRVLTLGRLPTGTLLGASLLSTALLMVAGYRLFKSLEPNFADVV
jgi:ABC-type polysaccharide/polyol phosphate export permease